MFVHRGHLSLLDHAGHKWGEKRQFVSTSDQRSYPFKFPCNPFVTPGNHRNHFKMAAKLSVEETIKLLEVEAEQDQDQISNEDEDGENSNVLKLLEASDPGISRMLFTCNINAGKIFKGELVLWLKGIYRRLAGRRNIRRPYFSQIRRDIPEEMFM